MKGNNKNKNGFALIGILIAVFIIAILAYGVYSWSGNKGGNTTPGAVKKQMNDLQNKVNEENERNLKILEETATTSN
jgi:type II secretory pathway pseudopilin PulG